MTPFDSNEGPAYKTHKETTPGGGIGIVTPSPHISHPLVGINKVDVNVGKDIGMNLCPSAWAIAGWTVGPEYSVWLSLPENFPPAKLGEKLGGKVGESLEDHPEDADPGEPEPGYPPEDI